MKVEKIDRLGGDKLTEELMMLTMATRSEESKAEGRSRTTAFLPLLIQLVPSFLLVLVMTLDMFDHDDDKQQGYQQVVYEASLEASPRANK